jgi:hypothetical protein
MSVWSDENKSSLQVKVVQSDPLSVLLEAIRDVKVLVVDLKDTDIAYVKQRIDKQWLAIDDMEKRKADRTEMRETEARLRDAIQNKWNRTSDDIVRVEGMAETADSTFESIQERLSEIEKETAKIQPMAKAIDTLNRTVGNLSAIRWQIIGGVTAIGILLISIDFLLRLFWHAGRFEDFFHH